MNYIFKNTKVIFSNRKQWKDIINNCQANDYILLLIISYIFLENVP